MTFKEIMALPWKEGSNQTTGEHVLKCLNGCYQQGEVGYLIPIGCMMIVFEVPDHEITMDELVKYVSVEDMELVYIKNSDASIHPQTFDDLCKIFGYTTDKVIEGSIPL